MKKFKNEKLYHCRACGIATEKEKWLRFEKQVHICPHCGALVDVSVANEITEPVQEADAPEPKSKAKK